MKITAASQGSVMIDLLKTAIEAHGGLERWNQLNSVSARLTQVRRCSGRSKVRQD